MRHRLLGNSGLRVSEAALGTMTFGDEWGWGAAKDEARKLYIEPVPQECITPSWYACMRPTVVAKKHSIS